ncbi:uncharacterized protein BDZ99DRAFT_344567, partial [Mytilinidion resinicola]
SSTWTYCGPLLPLTPSSLPASFDTWTNATFEPASALLPSLLPFVAYVNDFLKKAGLGNYWITVRATLPTNEYDTPRWHTDDLFFESPTSTEATSIVAPKSRWKLFSKTSTHNRRSSSVTPSDAPSALAPGTWKLCATLLGAPTLFLSPKTNSNALRVQSTAKSTASSKYAHPCTSTRCLGCATAANSVRQSLASTFDSLNFEVVSPAPGECCWFRLGAVEGAMHSEPNCSSNEGAQGRVFVNVVPGTEEQLKGLMGKWGMAFPRAWCVG